MRTVLLVLALGTATTAVAQDCATYVDRWLVEADAPGFGFALHISSDRIITLGNNSLDVYAHDGTASAPPTLVDSFSIPFQRLGRDLAVEGNVAFVLTNIDLYSVSLNGTPDVVDAIAFAPDYGDSYLALSGDRLAVSHGDDLHIVDVRNPRRMEILSTTPLAAEVNDLHVDGDLVALATNTGVSFYDISDPSAPVQVPSSVAGPASQVWLRGTSLFVGRPDGFGVEIYDVTVPATPMLLSSLAGSLGGSVASIHLAMDRLTVAEVVGYWTVVRLWDVADPAFADFLEEACRPGTSVAATDGQLTATADLSLLELGLSPVTVPSPIGNLAVPLTDGPAALLESQGKLYVAEFSTAGRVLILDSSDVMSPQLLGSLPLSAHADNRGIALRGSTLYVPAGIQLMGIDVSDPTAPQVIDATMASHKIWDLAVQGDYAYLAVGTNGIEVVDLSTGSPKRGSLPLNEMFVTELGAVEIAIWGANLFYTERFQIFPPDSPIDTNHRVMDISTPGQPVFVSFYETTTPTRGLTTDGASIVISDAAVLRFDGAQLSDYRTDEIPFAAGPDPLEVSSDASLVAAVRGIPSLALYSRNPITGLAAVQIDPQVPLSGVLVADQGIHVTGVGHYWFMPRPCGTLTAVEPPALEASVRILAPSPYVPGTHIRLVTNESRQVTLDVYDLRGRWVTTLGERRFEVGSSILVWDGTNRQGGRVGRGSYFLRARYEGTSTTTKLVVLW